MSSHSKKYIAAGVIVSNLVFVFIGAMVFPWFQAIQEVDQRVALLLMLLIGMVTISSAVAGYFWSYTGIPLKNLRWLAVGNLLWILVFFIFHPNIGLGNYNLLDYLLYNFFWKPALAIIIFCSLLGCWFGRRVLYE
jgi:hypothetical protein